MLKNIIHFLFRALMVLFGLLSITLLLISIFQKEWMEQAVEWVGQLIETLGYWNYGIAFSSAFIESFPIIGSMVPGMNIMMLVGGFWGKFHLWETILIASIGAMLGNYFGYFLGKRYGNSIIKNYGDWIGIGKTEQKILEKQIQKNGFWYIVLGKFHGTLRAFIPFIAGASRMQEKNFWIYNSIGSILWATTINILGYYFVEHYKIILEHMGKITTGLLLLFLAYLFFFKRDSVKKYWNEKNAEMMEKYQQTPKPQKQPENMKEKTWETQYEDISIRVENAWNCNGLTKEKIYLDNTVMYEYYGEMQTIGLYKEFLYKNRKITIKLGSKWHFMGVACQIFVDDTCIFGDRIIVFPGKKQ